MSYFEEPHGLEDDTKIGGSDNGSDSDSDNDSNSEAEQEQEEKEWKI